MRSENSEEKKLPREVVRQNEDVLLEGKITGERERERNLEKLCKRKVRRIHRNAHTQ